MEDFVMNNFGWKLLAAVALTVSLSAPGRAAVSSGGGEIDPINDAAGVLVPSSSGGTGTLYTTVEEQDSVLASLKATPVGSSQYQTTITGQPITFALLRVIFPGYFLPAGDLICQTGLVRVYRNASCVATISAGFQGCSLYTGGNYATLSYNTTRKCKRGTGFCVEVNQVLWTRNVYFDNRCTQLVHVDTGNDFLCN
jgi:hypothetical protein